MKSIVQVFESRKMFVVFLLGFSSGIPLALIGTGGTFQAWMKDSNVDISVIGLFSLVGLPYALKFLWSPLMDRFVPPFMGRRRGWLIVSQALLAVAIAVMAFSNPAVQPTFLAVISLLVAFSSSSQDIVVDAYRTDILVDEEVGPGASLYIIGYRIAMIVSGAVALMMASHLSWRNVYLAMSATLAVGVLATFMGPEPKTPVRAPKTLNDAIVLPFLEFFKRKGALEMLLFIVIYKLDIVFASAMTTPFILDLGFSKAELAAVAKVFGLAATVLGTLVGGAWMVRLGLERSLWIFGLAQGISNLTFTLLAHVGHNHLLMVASIAIENICSGMGNAAFVAFLMSLCDKRFSATQYALLSSLMAVGRVFGGAPSGFMAKSMGWEYYFFFSTLIAAPGLVLLTRFKKWQKIAA